MEKSITAPIAIIKVNGKTIGMMRNIRITENIQRGDVKGIGRLTPLERPALGWNGQLQCDFINVNFEKSTIPGAANRNVNTAEEFVNYLLLNEIPVEVIVFKKIPDDADPLSYKEEIYATISDLFLESDSFNIAEGQISGKNQSFSYLTPIIFPV